MNANEVLFEKVKQYIFDNKARNNFKIETESELAQRFNVSRYRIRKVLSTLTQMGFLDRAPRRGSSIRRPDTSSISDQIKFQFSIAGYDVTEYLEARMLFESSIIPLVIERMTPAYFARLKDIVNQMELNAGNAKKADKYDRDFHLLLLEVCGNRIMQSFSGVLVTYFRESEKYFLSLSAEYFIAIVDEHRKILKAISERNVEETTQHLKDHLLHMSRIITSGQLISHSVWKKEKS